MAVLSSRVLDTIFLRSTLENGCRFGLYHNYSFVDDIVPFLFLDQVFSHASDFCCDVVRSCRQMADRVVDKDPDRHRRKVGHHHTLPMDHDPDLVTMDDQGHHATALAVVFQADLEDLAVPLRRCVAVANWDQHSSMTVCRYLPQAQICPVEVSNYQHPVALSAVAAFRLDKMEVRRCSEDRHRASAWVVVEEAMCREEEVSEHKDHRSVEVEVFAPYRKACHRSVVVVYTHGHSRHCFEAGEVHDGHCNRQAAHVVVLDGPDRWRMAADRLSQDVCRMAVTDPGNRTRFVDLSQLDLQQEQVVAFYPPSVSVGRTRESPPWLVDPLASLVMVQSENRDVPGHLWR